MADLSTQRAQEVEVVTTGFYLEDAVDRLEKEEEILKRNKPVRPGKPNEPTLNKKQVKVTPYPTINPEIPFPAKWKLGAKVAGIGLAVAAIGMTLGYRMMFIMIIGIGLLCFGGYYALICFLRGGKEQRQEKERVSEQIRNSAEYINECQRIDEENRQRQIRADEEAQKQYENECERYKLLVQNYNETVQIYETETLPAWHEEMNALQTALKDTKTPLRELYDKNIIPATYRNKAALLYLAAFLGTSNYDMKFAIERYDMYITQYQQREQINLQNAQLKLMNETLENQQYANWLSEQRLELAEQGNDTLRSISNWQKADIATREFRRIQARRAAKKARK